MSEFTASEFMAPNWFFKLPNRIQVVIIVFACLHILAGVGAVIYYSKKNRKPAFSKKMT